MHCCAIQSITLSFLIVSVVGVGLADNQPADLVLHGGKIVTVDADRPQVESLAARGGKIVALGTDEEVKPLIGPKTRVIDLAGRLAVPGFIEGHGHFVGLGHSMQILDLTKAKTWEDIARQVAAAARTAPPGRWITGRGWHQSKWTKKPAPDVEGYPTHDLLSEAAPNHPVLLTHASGHALVANAMAMRLANVDASTSDPAGGEILHDAAGEPSGVFRETAQGLIYRAHSVALNKLPAAKHRAELLASIRLAGRECLKHGVTSFQDAGSSLATIDVFRALAKDGKLPVRLWVMVGDSNARMAAGLARARVVGAGDNFLTVRGIKRSIDGALGSHGAWMLEPYNDLPQSRGLNTSSLRSLRETARLAIANDYQLCVHAIGDRANRETLDLFADVFKKHPSEKSRRWRIEHAQHLHPDDIPRFAKLGVIASMQGIHCTSDAVFVTRRLGERRAAQGAYVWQSLLKSGAVVTNGSDVPVEPISPIASFYASVTRRLDRGATFFPKQKMTRQQALHSYTAAGAYAAFEEDIKGTLAVGKLADVVVLSEDIMTVPEEKIRGAKVDLTIIGGRVVYEREQE